MAEPPRHVPRKPPPAVGTAPRHAARSEELRDVRWHRSSRSTGANNCVETARPRQGPWAGLLAVRDSKRPSGPAVMFSAGVWRTFVAALRQP